MGSKKGNVLMQKMILYPALLIVPLILQGQSMSDQQFVEKAAQVNMTEAHLGQIAQQKGTMEDVRQFGQKIESHHKDANGKLTAAAGSMTVPQAIDAEHQQVIQKFDSLSGQSFDNQFRQTMIQDHQKAIDMFQKAQSEIGSQYLKNYITEHLPHLREHLDMAQKLGRQDSSSVSQQQGSTGLKSTKAQNSDFVMNLLHATNRARQAISNNDQQQAKNLIQQALNAANQLPTKAAGKSYVPLYTEISRYSVLGPIKDARGESGNTSGNTDQSADQQRFNQNRPVEQPQPTGQNDDEQGSNDVNQQRSTPGNPSPTVQRVVESYTTVGVDVEQAKAHLKAANDAIARGDMKAADEALKAVQNSVVMVSMASDMPLLRARENLILARSAAENRDYQRAGNALTAASKALSKYENDGGKYVNDAKTLRSEIDNYNRNIASDHTDLSNKVETWWDKITDWMTPAG